MAINLLKQAEKLGLLKFSISFIEKRKLILNEEGTKEITDKWEALERWVNSKVKVNINLSLDENLKELKKWIKKLNT